jgi:hypothetical protein
VSTAIHWFRRDLRIADNAALNAATAAHDQVVPLFVLSKWRGDHHWCGAAGIPVRMSRLACEESRSQRRAADRHIEVPPCGPKNAQAKQGCANIFHQ